MANPIILRLCERLRSNDAELTSLNLGSLPLFEITGEDTALVLEALIENNSVANLELSFPRKEVTEGQSPNDVNHDDDIAGQREGVQSRCGLLFKKVLERPDCPIRSITLRDPAPSGHCWSEICDALERNTTLQEVVIGSPASLFSRENTVPLDLDACQQLSRALSANSSSLKNLTLRRFHFLDIQGLACLVDALPLTIHKVELHQISSDNDFSSVLPTFCDRVKELSMIECCCTSSPSLSSSTLIKYPTQENGMLESSPRSRLQTLRLAQCNAKDFLHPIISHLQSGTFAIKEIDLCDVQIKSGDHGSDDIVAAMVSWLGTQSELEVIKLHGNDLSNVSFEGIVKAVSRHETLREVSVRNNCITGQNIDFNVLPPNLQVLDLSGNEGLGDSTWLSTLIRSNPQLQTCKLSSVSMTDRGLKNLCQAWLAQNDNNPSHLRVLDLRRNAFGAQGIKALSNLLSSPDSSVRDLDLSSCKLNDVAIEMLAHSLDQTSLLVQLCLAFNPFGNRGCSLLAESCKKMSALRSLDIQFAKFGQAGLGYFVSTLRENPNVDQFNYWTAGSFGGKMESMEKQISEWLLLNEAGRRVIKDEYAIPPGLFPLVLARARHVGNASALHYILHECVDVLKVAAPNSLECKNR